MHPLYRRVSFLSVWFGLACGVSVSHAQLRLSEHCEIRFAKRAEGIAAITAEDAFSRNLSRFDLQARMKTEREVTLADWREFVSGEVVEWDDSDRERVTGVLESIQKRLARLRLPLPEQIFLVATTGNEEGHAAYCRGNAIVLPIKVVRREKGALESLLIHELFHVLSNQNPKLRERLYAIVGFRETAEIAIHPSLADRRISNPDAPLIDCVMELTQGEAPLFAAPVLYATEPFEEKRNADLFGYLVFKLMVVEKNEAGDWQAVDREGKGVVLDPRKMPQFQEKIGRNTSYIVHPEEILADNFVHLVLEREKLPTPRIVEQLRAVLER